MFKYILYKRKIPLQENRSDHIYDISFPAI